MAFSRGSATRNAARKTQERARRETIQWHRGSGKGTPNGTGAQAWSGKGEKGSKFRFKVICNSRGCWGHRQDECPSVIRTCAVDQTDDIGEFEAGASDRTGVIMTSDGEAAIKTVVDEVAPLRPSVMTLWEEAPRGTIGRNGILEMAINSVTYQAKALK